MVQARIHMQEIKVDESVPAKLFKSYEEPLVRHRDSSSDVRSYPELFRPHCKHESHYRLRIRHAVLGNK